MALVAGVLLSGSGCGFVEVIMRQQWGPRNRLSNTEQLLFMGGLWFDWIMIIYWFSVQFLSSMTAKLRKVEIIFWKTFPNSSSRRQSQQIVVEVKHWRQEACSSPCLVFVRCRICKNRRLTICKLPPAEEGLNTSHLLAAAAGRYVNVLNWAVGEKLSAVKCFLYPHK